MWTIVGDLTERDAKGQRYAPVRCSCGTEALVRVNAAGALRSARCRRCTPGRPVAPDTAAGIEALRQRKPVALVRVSDPDGDARRARSLASYHRRKVERPKPTYPPKPYDAKTKARRKIQLLVRTGKVERGPCEGCGQPRADAHHDDYSKPLEVRWLCRKCHAAAHRGALVTAT